MVSCFVNQVHQRYEASLPIHQSEKWMLKGQQRHDTGKVGIGLNLLAIDHLKILRRLGLPRPP